MKIQALVAAVALVLAGTAFAADTTTTTTTTQSTAKSDNSAAGHMRSAKHKVKAKARHLRHRMHEQHARKTTTTTKHEHMASRHHDSMHNMGAARAPDVDVNANGRRARMDDAYANWNKTHN